MALRPIVIETEAGIEALPERVWPYLVDWERLDRWMKEASEIRVTSPEREGVGVTAEAKVRIAGITTSDPIRVTRWEPPEVLELEHLGWVKGSGFMRLRRRDRGTFLYWKETMIAPWGVAGAIGIRLWKPLMRRIFARDLRLLKTLVESERPG